MSQSAPINSFSSAVIDTAKGRRDERIDRKPTSDLRWLADELRAVRESLSRQQQAPAASDHQEAHPSCPLTRLRPFLRRHSLDEIEQFLGQIRTDLGPEILALPAYMSMQQRLLAARQDERSGRQ